MSIADRSVQGDVGTKYGALVRLASKELLKDLAPWWSLTVSSAVTAMGIYFYVGSMVRGAQFDGDIGRAYVESGTTGFVLLIIVSLVTILSSSKVAVTLQRRDIVLWRLTGVSERQTKMVVLVEVLIASLVGAFVGACSALALWPVWKLVLRGADMPYAESLASPPLAAFPIVVASLSVTAILGSIKAGNAAASLRPVALLKSTPRAKRGSSWFTILVIVAGIGLVAYLLFLVKHTSPDSGVTHITQKTTFIYLGTSVLYAVVLGFVGRHFVRYFLRTWTAIVPKAWSRSWFLANRQAGHELEISSSLVVPLAVSLILITGIFGYVGQAEDVAAALGVSFAGKGIDVGALIQLLGFPILITLINAGGLATATRSMKRRDAYLLIAIGAPRRTILLKLIFESLILIVTSSLISLIVYFINGVTFVIALRDGPVPNASFIWPSIAPYTVSIVAFAIFLVASVFTYRGIDKMRANELRGM